MIKFFVCFTIFVFLVTLYGVTAFNNNNSVCRTLWITTRITVIITILFFTCIAILL